VTKTFQGLEAAFSARSILSLAISVSQFLSMLRIERPRRDRLAGKPAFIA